MITNIRLQHFRSYEDAAFNFDPGVTIIVGPNASGKTNLLEAILFISRGMSYRAKDSELIHFGSAWARLDADTDEGPRVVKLMSEPQSAKTFEIHDQVVTRLHPSKMLPVVVFEPNHLLLLHGSPDMRRSFMDDLIEQSSVGFSTLRRHYKRVLSQRNALLKKNPKDLREQLFVWNLRLSELGGQIVRERMALIDLFSKRLPGLYSNLAGSQNVISLAYQSRCNPDSYESQLLHKLETSIDMDVIRGFTAYGPHRDDIEIYIDEKPAREIASRGETRTLVLGLKILELQIIEEVQKSKPILLLDDVFSELDSKRRHALTEYVKSYQTFITTTDADIVTTHFTEGSSTISTARKG